MASPVVRQQTKLETLNLGASGKKYFTFGRNPELCDFEVAHGSLSREHAAVVRGCPPGTSRELGGRRTGAAPRASGTRGRVQFTGAIARYLRRFGWLLDLDSLSSAGLEGSKVAAILIDLGSANGTYIGTTEDDMKLVRTTAAFV